MILIIGHGFIGKAIFTDLVKKGHPVKIFARSLPENIAKNNFIGRIEEIEEHEHILDGVTTIIHAVHTTVPSTSRNAVKDIESNVIPFIKLLNLCAEKKIQKFIYLSSGGAVYGTPVNSQPINESHLTNPISPYGISKLTNEKFLSMYASAFSKGMVILRPSNIFGVGQNIVSPQGIIAHLIHAATTHTPISIWGNGESRKDYLYLEDFVEGITEIIVNDTHTLNNVYNLSFGKTFSINEIIALVEKVTGAKINRNYTALQNFDVADIALDNSLFRKNYLWSPKISLEKGIENIFVSMLL